MEKKGGPTPRHRGPVCALNSPRINAADLAALRAALETPTISTSSIWRWLEKRGFSVCLQTVQRHRRGECNCRRVL
jgi:hypothetical protein